MILDAYYNPVSDIWMVQDGYLYRTIEQLCEEAADALRWSIRRELYLQYRKENPYYHITGA
jgi:hypothetical protein